MAQLIDGRKLANNIYTNLKKSINANKHPRPPGLATILVGENKASIIYVKNKRKKAKSIGINSFRYELKSQTREYELLSLIKDLNNNDFVDGILVQLPLPAHINQAKIIEAIDPKKDVDGFHPHNLGHLLSDDNRIIACTPKGIMYMLDSIGYNLLGKHAVVVGKSNIVGKPTAQLLLQREATVTICHKFTTDLKHFTKQADVLIVAAGKKNLIKNSDVKPSAIVIDVGINRDENNNIVGDVNFLEVSKVASYITPVPGGVGPLTVAMLLKNTYESFIKNLNTP